MILSFILFFSFNLHVQSKTGTEDQKADSGVELIRVYPSMEYWGWNLRPANTELIEADDLQRSAIGQLEEALTSISNINFAGGSNRSRFFQLRGLGERSLYEGVPNHSVGVFLDHIDLSGVGGVATDHSLQRIEILKGPQSTYFGSSALAGLIEMFSYNGEKVSKIAVGAGSQNKKTLSAVYSEDLFHIAAGVNDEDGGIKNTFKNSSRTAKRTESFLKGHYLWEGSGWFLKNNWIWLKNDNGYDNWGLDGSRTTISDRPGIDAQSTLGTSVEFLYNARSELKWRTIYSQASSSLDYNYDEDWGNNAYWQPINSGKNYDYNIENYRQRKVSHLKTQLELYDWIVGTHGYQLDEDSKIFSYKDGVFRKTPLFGKFSSRSLAVFLSRKMEIGESWQLAGALRKEWQKLDYSDSNDITLQPNHQDWALNLELSKIWSPSFRSVAIFSRGYKMGGFNVGGNIDSRFRFFQPESVVNMELTNLYKTPDLNLTLSIFHMKLENQQIKSSYQDDPTNPSSFTEIIDNAAESFSRGVEAKMDFYISPRVRYDFNIGFLQAQFIDYTFQTEKFSGRALAHAPKYTVASGVDVELNKSWTVRPEIRAKDSFFFSNSHNQTSTVHRSLNFIASYRDNHWLFQSWVKNITDHKNEIRGFYFANEPPKWDRKKYIQLGEERAFGVEAVYEF